MDEDTVYSHRNTLGIKVYLGGGEGGSLNIGGYSIPSSSSAEIAWQSDGIHLTRSGVPISQADINLGKTAVSINYLQGSSVKTDEVTTLIKD